MADMIPIVDYLELGDDPPSTAHLVATVCTACGARYFDRRSACASCSGLEFHTEPVVTTGEVTSFTIVTASGPGIPVPFVAGIIDCGGTAVRGLVVNTPADPDHVALGMKVRLTTFSIGADAEGTEAINYGFEPIDINTAEASNGN